MVTILIFMHGVQLLRRAAVRGLVGLILGAAQTEHLLGFTPRDLLPRHGPGRPGAIKRPQRFSMKIHFVWGFCMGAQGA